MVFIVRHSTWGRSRAAETLLSPSKHLVMETPAAGECFCISGLLASLTHILYRSSIDADSYRATQEAFCHGTPYFM